MPVIEAIILTVATALLLSGTIIVIELVILLFEELINWFNSVDTVDKEAICFTIEQAIKNDEVTIIQGVLDKKTDKLVDARQIKAEKVDQRVKAAHQRHKVAIYT